MSEIHNVMADLLRPNLEFGSVITLVLFDFVLLLYLSSCCHSVCIQHEKTNSGNGFEVSLSFFSNILHRNHELNFFVLSLFTIFLSGFIKFACHLMTKKRFKTLLYDKMNASKVQGIHKLT